MPLALVFTSAPRGLVPGRTGYVTVARHESMPPRLAEMLESIGTPHAEPGGCTFTLRSLEAGGRRWRVVSRFAAGGLDHTLRDNRIAHHLAFAEDEVAALPPPADIARRWPGWLDGWQGEPAWLAPLRLDLRPGQPLVPCSGWRELTGTGAKAGWLVAGENPAPRSISGQSDPATWLRLLAESGALLGPAAWDAAFTTDAAVTGSAGFTWRCQAQGGDIDLGQARELPAPDGPAARRAALGFAAAPPARADAGRTARETPPPRPPTSPLLIALAGLAIAGMAGVAWLALRPDRKPPPAPQAPAAPPRAPSQAELEATRDLLRDQRALAEIDERIQRDDVAQAARLWRELARRAPAFAQRNTEPTLARIRSRLALSASRDLARQLSQPANAADAARAAALATEADEVLALGTELGMPEDEARKGLVRTRDIARLLGGLDIRPTLVVRGRWVTASAGPGIPSAADFDLGPEAGSEVRSFLSEGILGGPGATARGGIRLVAFRHPAHRDPSAPRVAAASIEPGASSVYAGEAVASGGRPAVSVTVGSRANTVSLNLPGRPGEDFLRSPLGLELTNAQGRRLCLALLPPEASLEPLRLPLEALAEEDVTRALAPAPWIEPALGSVRVAGARVGIYPAGQSFPDRALPSPVSPPSQLDTTLLRLAAGQGPSMPRSELAERQRLAREGKAREAGAPWTLRAVNLQGEPVLTLAEFAQ